MDRTRALADPEVLRQRLAQLDAPHVAPLNNFVRDLRLTRGGGDSVPWFDPASGGINSELLFLLEAPGARSVATDGLRTKAGSGIISPDNNDVTASNTSKLRDEAGLDRSRVLHWNAVPWYIGDTNTIRPANDDDRREAQPALRSVLKLLPNLRVVVTMGRAAQISWSMYVERQTVDIVTIPCVHPSPRAMNRWPDSWSRAVRSLTIARLALDEWSAPPAGRGAHD